MENRYKINYNIKQRCITNIKFKQGDTDSAVLEVTLIDNGQVVDITGESIEFRFLKPDGTIVYQNTQTGVKITDTTGGVVECILKNNTLASAGVVKTEIYRKKDGKELTTPSFFFTVEESIGEGGILSSNYIGAFEGKLIEWEKKETARQATFEGNEHIREDTFKLCEDKRENAFRSNENIRQDAFESTQSENKKTFNTNEVTRNTNETARVNEFETIKKDYDSYKKVMIAESNVAALQQQINTTNSSLKDVSGLVTGAIDKDITAVLNNEIVTTDIKNKLLVKEIEYSPRLSKLEKDNVTPHFDKTLGEYVGLKNFWDSLRTGKKYTVEFNQFSLSPSPLGTKKDDNEGLICEPSTNTVKGKNDYENIGLFMSIDVNGYVDENDDYHVTAIKGDKYFKNDGTNGDVYVMAMPGYQKRNFGENTWGISYSDVMLPGYEIIHEAIKPDGTVRPYLLHAKYVAGINPKDGKLASISGVNAEYNSMSHDGQIDQFKAKGIQYSGKTSHDDYYVQLMMWLKYATLNSETVMKGCMSYYLQYAPTILETNVKRFIVTNAQASSLVVGSCVSIGDYNGSTKTDDRQQARNYNIANRVNIISLEPLGDGINTAINVNATTAFITTATSTITTYPWRSGGCDNVLGTDGSPYSNASGKEPCMINGIEFMVGGYEVIQNLIIYNDNTNPNNYNIKVYVNYDCKTYNKGSATNSYDLISYRLAQTNQVWSYISRLGTDNDNSSVMIPIEADASSTTGFADGLYSNSPTTGYREWLSLGNLSAGSVCGLRCLNANYGLSFAGWSFLGRLSATGRSQRRAGVN